MAWPKGKPRPPNSGRRKGVRNKATSAKVSLANKAAAEGLTPLEFMLKIMRDDNADLSRRDDMAKAAAPYVHPRLATSEVKMTVDFVAELEQARARVLRGVEKLPPEVRATLQ